MAHLKRSFKKFLLSGALAFAPFCTQADDEVLMTAFVTEDEFLASMPIVLTATRISQPVTEVPVSMTVIDREMIEASGFRDLADVLRLVPGFQVAHGNGTYFVPTYHGLVDDWPRHLQVQVDGRSVYLPLLSTVNWVHIGISIEDVERIEVIRGSNNAVYGANAFRGVVNIITKQPFQDIGSAVQVTAGALEAGQLRAGVEEKDFDRVADSLTSREVFARHGFTMGNWDFRLSGNYREDPGFAGVHDSKYIKSVSLRSTGSLSNTDALDIQLGYTEGPSGSGTIEGTMDLENPPRNIERQSNYQSIVWTRATGASSDLTARFYHNYFNQDDEINLGLFSDVLSAETGQSIAPAQIPILFPGIEDQDVYFSSLEGLVERYDAEVQQVLRRANAFELVWGVGLRQDSLNSRSMLTHDDTIYDVSQRIFANANLHVNPALHVNVGSMVEHNRIVGEFFSPRVGINYLFTPHRSVRFSVAHSERTPSLLEANIRHAAMLEDGTPLTYYRVADENITTEKLSSMEIGYVERFSKIDTTLDIKWFRERLRDVIFDATDEGFTGQPIIMEGDMANLDGIPDVPVVDESPFVYINGVNADLKGVEVQLQYRPSPYNFITLQYGYIEPDATQLRFLNLDGSDPDKETYRPVHFGVPWHTTSMLMSHRFSGRLDVSLGYYRMTRMRWYGDGDTIWKHQRWDARIAKRFHISKRVRAHSAVILQNLTKDYQEFRQENVFNQRVFLQGGIEF